MWPSADTWCGMSAWGTTRTTWGAPSSAARTAAAAAFHSGEPAVAESLR